MEIPEILQALAHTDNKFPRQALEQAIANRDEIIPHLLDIVERTADNPEETLAKNDYSFLYAIHLLAQCREQRAYPLIVKLAALPASLVNELLGDTITEGLPSILASVCQGDSSLIESLAENREAEEFVRDAGLQALLVLVAVGEKSREEVLAYYKSLFRGKLEKEPSFVWDGLIGSATYLYPEEVYEDIKQAFEEGLADETVADLAWVDKQMALGKEALLSKLRKDYHLIEDSIQEIEGWACFTEPATSATKELQNTLMESLLAPQLEKPFKVASRLEAEEPQLPYKAPKKIGRNDPCSCGSGKKYKKCCGA